MYLVPSRQPYIVKYGGARVKAVSQTAKPYSLTPEIGDLDNCAYSHALVVCVHVSISLTTIDDRSAHV
ncbi:hypothetical protein SeMB42_g02355 [Synchytrium endobioticum]|uniref:Uncharacterized protein n=1 Tax=Synchytrium endobioticum TaxID=286115 RepID=A0A507DFH2_9FUNG|nr:hypothetical protein SeMB42_g02355 [Synchytrium endobioticum]